MIFDTALPSDLIMGPRSCPTGKFIYLTEQSAWDEVNKLWENGTGQYTDLPDYADYCGDCGFYHLFHSDPEDWHND